MGKAEQTKQHIIEQAAPIFNEKGIAGTTVDDVLAAAKVARGCLYSHFENKDDLSLQTVDYLLNKMTGHIRTLMAAESTSKGKIYAYLNAAKNPLSSYIDGGCPILNMAAESDDNHPEVKEKVKEKVSSSQKLFSSILSTGIKNGEWKTSLNPSDFANKIFFAIEGAIVFCRILENNKAMLALINNLKAELESHE